MPTPKNKAVRKTTRVANKIARKKANTVERGKRLKSRATKQLNRARTRTSKEISKQAKSGELKGPSQRNRLKRDDAVMKINSANSMIKAPTSKERPKKRVYRDAPAPGYGKNTYVSKTGNRVVRKKRR
jgi:3-hydroxyacyl-CoA dehydrogenase